MKALIFNRYGKRDNIAFADIPRPVPKPDEMLVQIHAVGLNPIDTMIPKGTFKPFLKFNLPATLGSDLAGVVVEVGISPPNEFHLARKKSLSYRLSRNSQKGVGCCWNGTICGWCLASIAPVR